MAESPEQRRARVTSEWVQTKQQIAEFGPILCALTSVSTPGLAMKEFVAEPTMAADAVKFAAAEGRLQRRRAHGLRLGDWYA